MDMQGVLEPCDTNWKPNTTYDFIKDIKPYRFHKDIPNKKDKKVFVKLNNYGQRSSDFQKVDKSKVNILFAGCSVTFGEGLPEKYTWPYYVLYKMKEAGVDVSSDQVLSYPGGSADRIVANIFRYVQEFGAPDIMCVLLPDFFRKYSYSDDIKSYRTSMLYDFSKDELFPEFLDIDVYSIIAGYKKQYEMLKILCSVLNIKLYTTSWHSPTRSFMHDVLDEDFIPFTYDDIQKFSESDKIDLDYLETLDSDFITEASDKVHPGGLTQMFFGDKFINKMGVK